MKKNAGERFEHWRMHRPFGEKDCCNKDHYNPDGTPKPDTEVCNRELAWRKYVREREEDYQWPFENN